MNKLRTLDLAAITPTKDNARKISKQDPDIKDLAESIKAVGVRVPIHVRDLGDDKYEIRAGERRYRASIAAGFTTIPAIIFDKMTTDDEAMITTIIENSNRKALSISEQMTEINTLNAKLDGDVPAVASVMQLTESQIRRLIHARKSLSKKMLAAIGNPEHEFCKLTLAHLGCIGRLTSEQQDNLLEFPRRVFDYHHGMLSVAALEKLISNQYRDSLLGVGWDLEEAFGGLKACSKCPMRSDHEPELFADLTTETKGKVNVQCLNKECMDMKRILTMKGNLIVLEAKHPGIKVFFPQSMNIKREEKTVLMGKPGGQDYSPTWAKEHHAYNLDRTKKSTKGAIPVAVPALSGKVTVAYIKPGGARPSSTGGNAGGQVGPKSLKQRREGLDSKRWHQANGVFVAWLAEQEHTVFDLNKIKHDLGDDAGYFEVFSALIAVTSKANDWNLDWSFGEPLDFSRDKVVEVLWLDIRSHLLNKANWQMCGVTQIESHHINAMKIVADLMNYDLAEQFQIAKAEILEPKSWAKLNADGTPKAKPTKETRKLGKG